MIQNVSIKNIYVLFKKTIGGISMGTSHNHGWYTPILDTCCGALLSSSSLHNIEVHWWFVFGGRPMSFAQSLYSREDVLGEG